MVMRSWRLPQQGVQSSWQKEGKRHLRNGWKSLLIYISHNHNYARTTEKFNVSYQQARNYTIKYEKNGTVSCWTRKTPGRIEIRKSQAGEGRNGGIIPKKLSAILDLYDRRIVSYVIRDNNNNALVFETFAQAIAQKLTHIHCAIATEDFSIQIESSTTNWKPQAWPKACPEWQNV